MPNRFENPLAAQFINTYTPIPFQEMVAAGQMKQQRYDQASKAMDSAIGAIDEIMAIPNSADELRAKEYSDKMRTIRDKYVTRDLSDPFVQREMSNELNSAIKKEDIKHIQQSYQGYVNYNKMLAENAQRGVDTPVELQQNFTGYDSSNPLMGVFTGTPSMYKDPLKESEEFFNNLKSNELGSFKEMINGVETGRIGTKSGVTVNRILEHADKNIDAFTKLPSIKQMIEVAKRRGDTRPAEVIAKEYVKAHAPEWAHEESSNYAYDPFYKERANGGTDKELPPPTEIKGITGNDAASSEPQSKRYWAKEQSKLENDVANATNEYDKTKALNNLQVFKDIRDSKYAEVTPKVETLYETGLKEIYNNAIDVLTTKEGMSRDEALSFVSGLIKNRETKGDFKETMDNITLALESTPGQLVGNFRRNLTKDAVQDHITNTIIKKTPALLYNSLTFNKEGIKQASHDMQASVDAITNSWGKISKEFEGKATNKGEVVKSVFNSLNELDKQIGEFEKETSKAITNDLNKTLPNQFTYTTFNNEYTKDSSGIIKYDTKDSQGNPVKQKSAIMESLKDYVTNPENYMSKFKKGEDLSKSKKTLEKLKSAMDASMDMQIETISDIPDAQGNLQATISIVSKNKNGDPVRSNPMEVILPNVYENRANYVDELKALGKDNLAFNIQYYNAIKEEVTSFPWYAKNEQVIDLGNGSITITKNGNKFDVKTPNPNIGASGLNYNELPDRVKDIVFSLTRQQK